MLFSAQVDASRSVDEVFVDVCTIFGDLPKLEKKRRKKGQCYPLQVDAEKEKNVCHGCCLGDQVNPFSLYILTKVRKSSYGPMAS